MDVRNHHEQFDPEKSERGGENLAEIGRFGEGNRREYLDFQVNTAPFIGRLGGNGEVSLSRNASTEEVLKDIPDATPLMTLAQVFDLRPFHTIGLWKAALMEGMGKISGIHRVEQTRFVRRYLHICRNAHDCLANHLRQHFPSRDSRYSNPTMGQL
jgi:hypothetical protein